MFSYFFPANEKQNKSRFESTVELKELVPILTAMRNKATALKKDADYYGSGTLHFLKHSAFQSILCDIESAIDEFNIIDPNESNSKLVSIHFVNNLFHRLTDLINNDKYILERHRGTIKNNSNKIVKFTSTSAFIAGWATSSFLGGLGAKLATDFSLGTIIQVFQLDGETESLTLLEIFNKKLSAIGTNLENDLKNNQIKLTSAKSKIEKKRAAYVLNHPDVFELPLEIKSHILSFFDQADTRYDRHILKNENYSLVRQSMF